MSLRNLASMCVCVGGGVGMGMVNCEAACVLEYKVVYGGWKLTHLQREKLVFEFDMWDNKLRGIFFPFGSFSRVYRAILLPHFTFFS